MKKLSTLNIVNTLTTILVITVNVLANALPLNGLNTGEISDRFDIYFVPAGYVFSIWGLIYIGLIAFTLYQLLPQGRENSKVRNIGYLYALSGIANIVWIFFWHYEVFLLTPVAMLILLTSLVALYLRLGIGRATFSTAERWTLQVPFSIYLGWISVATVANVTQWLYYIDWGGWGLSPEVWALVMLIVAAAIAGTVIWTRRDAAYGLVFVWAYAGIAVKHAATPIVSVPAGILAGIIALVILVRFLRRSGEPAAVPAG
ncbi:MAG: tryptophan-rich sensory protein [Anaerolineae bacterium]